MRGTSTPAGELGVAVAQAHAAVGVLEEVELVGRDHDRGAGRGGLDEQLGERALAGGVETDERLVDEQHRERPDEPEHERRLLAQAAAEAARAGRRRGASSSSSSSSSSARSGQSSTPWSRPMYSMCSLTLTGRRRAPARRARTTASARALQRSRAARSRPRASPSLGSSRPAASRRNVDLPEPLWPTSATSSPGSTLRLEVVERDEVVVLLREPVGDETAIRTRPTSGSGGTRRRRPRSTSAGSAASARSRSGPPCWCTASRARYRCDGDRGEERREHLAEDEPDRRGLGERQREPAADFGAPRTTANAAAEAAANATGTTVITPTRSRPGSGSSTGRRPTR